MVRCAFNAILTGLILFVCVGCTSTGESKLAEAPRQRSSFDAGWKFSKIDPAQDDRRLSYDGLKTYLLDRAAIFTTAATTQPSEPNQISAAASEIGFDDSSWRTLDLPHDWGIEGPFQQELPGETGKRPYAGTAWYRKHLTVSANDAGRRIALAIDGAMSYSSVWVNGTLAGGWPYGYASYQVDLTPFLKQGDNLIAIRLENPDGSSRWYPGGGIYRNVWLIKTDAVHVAQYETYVTTPTISEQSATVAVKLSVQNDSAATAYTNVSYAIYAADAAGKPTGSVITRQSGSKLSIGAQSREETTANLALPHPKLWDLDSPACYVLETTLSRDGKTVDRYNTTFGVRTIAFDPNRGLMLNGKHVPLQGVCDHHDLGPLGSALNTRALERQIELLKEMGCNAIRTSHNPPAPELLELCDRMGVLVMDESFDCWAIGKRSNDYHTIFSDWHERDWRSQLRRDRNHPCVVLWSIGNELQEFRPDKPGGTEIAAELTRIAHEEDPTRPTTFACNIVAAAYNGFAKTVDVYGFNYKPNEYGKFHEKYPEIPVFGSETASCISTRGEYFFPVSDDKSKGKQDFQVSSYDLSAPPWATTPDTEFKGQDQFPFSAGEFVWTGFDYIGEPTPYNRDESTLLNIADRGEQARLAKDVAALKKLQMPSRSSYFGILDLCGFKKDRFYSYQSRWRPQLPMAHILPHWNWPERVGQVTPVHVYTSGDEAELFLNGRSLGRKAKKPLEYRLRWDDVVYEPGELKVVTYKNGRHWADDVVRTTGSPAGLQLKADRPRIANDGQDLSFITVSVVDSNGMIVPRSKNDLHFSINGPGEIVAIDNGDPTAHRAFQSTDCPAFNGLCLVIVRAKHGQTGSMTLEARGDGLKLASLNLSAAASK